VVNHVLTQVRVSEQPVSKEALLADEDDDAPSTEEAGATA
jgi:hypothetical protein